MYLPPLCSKKLVWTYKLYGSTIILYWLKQSTQFHSKVSKFDLFLLLSASFWQFLANIPTPMLKMDLRSSLLKESNLTRSVRIYNVWYSLVSYWGILVKDVFYHNVVIVVIAVYITKKVSPASLIPPSKQTIKWFSTEMVNKCVNGYFENTELYVLLWVQTI